MRFKEQGGDQREEFGEHTAETVKELAKAGFEFSQVNFARKLEAEIDLDEKPYNGSVYWIEFQDSPDGPAKTGKLFLPSGEFNSRLVAIYGGLPGDDIVKIEQRFAGELANNGYAVWASRHNGLKLEEDNVAPFFGSKSIVEEQRAEGRVFSGEQLQPDFLVDFVKEPGMDMAEFAKNSKIGEIIMIGHSFGAASILHSMRRDQEENGGKNFSKVKKLVLVNGLLGEGIFPEDESQPIPGMHLSAKQLAENQVPKAEKYFKFDQKPTIDSFKPIVEYIHGAKIPQEVEVITVVNPNDAYLTPEAAEGFYDRHDSTVLVYDLTQGSVAPKQKNENNVFGPEFSDATPEEIRLANEESNRLYGGSQHSATNFRGSTLRRLIELDNIGKKHRVVFRSQE